MRDAILKRISRRNYIETPIETEKIQALIEAVNHASGLSFTFVEDAGPAFRHMRKSYGMFSGVRSVVVLKGAENTPHLAEKIGYFGERLMLDITDLGLGTCWVAGTFDPAYFTVPAGEAMLCVMTVGYAAKQSTKERLMRRIIAPNRKPVSQRLRGYEHAPEWVLEAMEAVRLAPSAVNRQGTYFTYADGTVTAAIDASRTSDLIDMGIAKLHFAIEAGGHFEFGQNGIFRKD